MFYQCPPPLTDGKQVAAMVSLTPAESKRIIARGITVLPEIKRALKEGVIIIGRGTTNTFVTEELLGSVIENKAEYSRGIITNGELKVNLRRGGGYDFVLKDGELWNAKPQEVILQFTRNDVFLKGASAIDASGEAAVLAANPEAGTIGYAMMPLTARGANLIVPVGLEKMVPSVAAAVRKCGVYNYKYSTGSPCSLIPLINAKVVTEIQALSLLFGVNATHVASGGIGGSEGSVVLVIEGTATCLEKAFDFIKSIKGEKPVPSPMVMGAPASSFNFDARAIQGADRR
ncbi:MAG: hypothetical protein V1894_05545 [Chloroflexota bacterium]